MKSSVNFASIAGQDQEIKATTNRAKLQDAAHEFEASLMKEMTEHLQGSWTTMDGEEDEGSKSSLSAYATEAVAKAIAASGGFGIARSVLEKLNPLPANSQEMQTGSNKT